MIINIQNKKHTKQTTKTKTMGNQSSNIPALDEAVARVVEHYDAHKGATGAAETALARELGAALVALRRAPEHKLRARAGVTDSVPACYVSAHLEELVRVALERGHVRVFSALFRHLLALEKQMMGPRDAVTLFVKVALRTIDTRDVAGGCALDRALVARCLGLVFTRFRGDANAPSNQDHGGARTPLIEAIQARRPELVRVLLAHGADACCASYNDEMPILWACAADSAELVAMLAPHSRRAFAHLTQNTFRRSALRRGLSRHVRGADAERYCALLVGAGGIAQD